MSGHIFRPSSSDEARRRQEAEHALDFVRTWAEAVLRQVTEIEAIRRREDGLDRMLGEDGVTVDLLAEVNREQWAAEHTLLWAAFQLERWRDRLDKARGHEPREADRKLRLARNGLEHLDDADFIAGRAVAPPQPEGRRDPYWSLRELGGIDLSLRSDTVCGIDGIDGAELRARALDVVRSVENDLAEDAAEAYLALLRG